MRGHGSLQQMLGKRVTGAKKKAGQDNTEAGQTAKRQNSGLPGIVGTGDGRHAGAGMQQKLDCFFKVQQPKPSAGSQQRTQPESLLKGASVSQATAAVVPERMSSQHVCTIYTRIVGRQHQDKEQAPPSIGEELVILREPDNPVDSCAILVCSRTRAGGKRAHGHLPASVASHLAALLDAGQIEAVAQLTDETGTGGGTAASDLTLSSTAAASAAASSTGSGGPENSSADSSSLTRFLSSGGQWRVKIVATVVDTSRAAGVTAALEAAAAAGIQSLAPGKNNGAVLTASFEHILQQARQYDLHLLDAQEQAVLHSMQGLPQPAKSLLLRLLMRKRSWFQLSNLAYPDVPDSTAAARQLAAAGLICWSGNAAAELHTLLPELPVVLLKQLLGQLLPRNHPALVTARSRSGSTAAGAGAVAEDSHTAKTALVASIQSCCHTASCWTQLQAAIHAASGMWLTVLPVVTATFNRLQHLYFLSPGQDLGMFLAVDRGALRYPAYTVSRQRPVFSCRQHLLDYEQALALAANVERALEEGDHTAAWQLLQPALAALRAGSHKAIVWQEEHGATMPNPRATQQELAHPKQQAVQQQCLQQQQTHQQQAHAQHHQQHHQLDTLRSPSPRPAYINTYSPAREHSRSRSPSPRSPSPADSSNSQTSSSSCSWSSCGPSQSCTSSSQGWHAPAEGAAATTAGLATAVAQAGDVEQDGSCTIVQQLNHDTATEMQNSPVKSMHCTHTVLQHEHQQAVPAAHDQQGRQQQHEQLAAAVAWSSQPPPLYLARFCAGWVHGSLGTVAVSLLEKQKKYEEAVELLRLLLGGNACVGRRGEWWERLAINLEHLELPEQALEAVEASLADSWVRWGDRLGLQRRLLRLGKPPRRWKRPAWAVQVAWEPPEYAITGRPLNCTTGAKSRFYGLDGSQVTVEQLALQHYASEEGGGWQGLHSEGGVWSTLFGLLLWDVIFMSVPDVFRSPFQVAPLDLGSDAFYHARREQLDKQLSRIADGEAGNILTATWSAHFGVMCRGVNWQRFDCATLMDICECVGGLGLAAVLRLMAEDLSGASGGLPDLLLWRPCDNIAKMVEVKGPRDKLSHQQRFWLAHMSHSSMQVEVCKVREPGATGKATRLHARN